MEFLSLEESNTGSSESTLVKMPHCWKSHVMAHKNIYNKLFVVCAAIEIHEVLSALHTI